MLPSHLLQLLIDVKEQLQLQGSEYNHAGAEPDGEGKVNEGGCKYHPIIC